MSEIIFKEASNENRAIWIQFREILYKGVDRAFHEKDVDSIIKDPAKTAFLCFEKNTSFPSGMLELSLRNIVDGCLSSPVGYIEGIYVSEEMRGKGWGKEMVEYSKNWAKSKGCAELAVDAELDEIDAQNFHKKMGFEETYRIVQYKMKIENR